MYTGFVQRGLPRSSPKNAAAPLYDDAHTFKYLPVPFAYHRIWFLRKKSQYEASFNRTHRRAATPLFSLKNAASPLYDNAARYVRIHPEASKCEMLRRASIHTKCDCVATSAFARMRAPKRERVECSGLAVVLPFPVFPLFPVSIANDQIRSTNDDTRSVAGVWR